MAQLTFWNDGLDIYLPKVSEELQIQKLVCSNGGTMKIPNEVECVCSKCGGPGLATTDGAAGLWLGGTLVHSDPEECIRYLKSIQKEKANEVR